MRKRLVGNWFDFNGFIALNGGMQIMASTTYRPATKDKGDTWEHAKDAGKDTMNKAKEAGQDTLDKAKDVGQDAMNKAKEVGGEALGKVREAGGAALDKAKEAVGSVGDMATESAAAVGRKAEDMTAAAGHRIAGLGDTIAEKGPQEGFAGKAAHAVADTIRSSGQYIEEHKLSGMARDVEQVVKNHPIPALLMVFGIGFCLGRVLKD